MLFIAVFCQKQIPDSGKACGKRRNDHGSKCRADSFKVGPVGNASYNRAGFGGDNTEKCLNKGLERSNEAISFHTVHLRA